MQFIKYKLIITLCFMSLLGISQNKVGIGTQSPDAKLTVHSDTTGIKSVVNFVGSVDLRSIYGYSKPNPGWGYGAEFEGGYIGVSGKATAEDYSGQAFGMFASATGTSGDRYGIYGLANSVGPNNNIGVYGSANGAANNWAGYFNGNGYFKDSLGVGVQYPSERVHIFGNLRVDSGIINSWGQLTFHPDVDLSGDDVIQFLDSDGNETVRIHSNGNVGIGNSNPMANLQVGTNSESKVIVSPLTYSSNAELILGEGQGNIGIKILYDGVEDKFKLLEETNVGTPETFMVIDRNNGRISIGKDDPQTDLEVKVDLNTTSVHSGIQLNASERRWRMTVGGSKSPNAAYYQLLYRNHDQSTYTPHMTVTHTGAFGFGTTDIPAGYKMALAGKVICEEVRVDLESNWPDYVFDQDYDLKSLDEVQQYIVKNGHLPGIPSASKIEKEGLALGEMNRKLMEKIEELTLYLIEMKEENEVLRLRVENLENK